MLIPLAQRPRPDDAKPGKSEQWPVDDTAAIANRDTLPTDSGPLPQTAPDVVESAADTTA